MKLRELRFVDRLHSEPVLKGQSVAEHTFGVLAILDEVGRPDLFRYALYHDVLEQYTGDIPSPFKKVVPEIKEAEERMTIIHEIPFPESAEDETVIKAADILELVLTCREEQHMGNALIHHVLAKAETYFIDQLSNINGLEEYEKLKAIFNRGNDHEI